MRAAIAFDRAEAAVLGLMSAGRQRLSGLHARLLAFRPDRIIGRYRQRLGELFRRCWRARVVEAWGRVEGAVRGLVAQWRASSEQFWARAQRAIGPALARERLRLDALSGRLAALNPKAVLRRGYSITFLLPKREVVRSCGQVEPGDGLEIMVSDGSFEAQVLAAPAATARNYGAGEGSKG